MKNRAPLLALIVLTIATLLMIFVVLPRMNSGKADLQDAASKAGETVKDAAQTAEQAAPQAIAQLKEKATATLEKLDRLSDGSSEAVGSLATLFDKGRIPGAEELAAAKQKAEASLNELAATDVPEGIAGEALAAANKLKDEAGKALAWVKGLPGEPAAAAAAIGEIKTIFPKAFETATEAPAEEKPAAAAAGSVLPSFDVLRVEPDGATVIAGRAGPGVTVEIVSGDAVLSKAVTGQGGEFAAVLDQPLPPGDHQLALRATGADGAVALSGEVATVSVPQDKSGQLLAMISTPGQASRLLTIPATPDAAPVEAAKPPVEGTATDAPAATQPAPQGNGVLVSAVEVEGDKLFVAGQTRPGVKLRAFAGNTLIGEGVADATGNFVVDGAVPLAPGDHMIVVELLDDAGNVTVKSSVPFNRPEGNQVAAVANAAALPDLGETGVKLSGLRENVTKAFILLRSLFDGGKVPGKEELAAARSATELSLKALSEFLPDADASAAAKNASTAASTAAAQAFTALSALPTDAGAVSKALGAISTSIETVTKPAPVATEGQQAPLTRSEEAVIIRRGDTLWQISRRLYGQGVRYTTIYLANRKDISNPDLIEPGQVFTVPRDALPNAEELHRKRLSGEALQ